MKRTEPELIGDIISCVINQSDAKAEFDRQKAAYHWADVVGPVINQATARRFVQGDVLHVFITSSAIKSELRFVTDRLTDKINEAAGAPVIKKIKIH